MGRTACTEPQCLYKGALYLNLTIPFMFSMINRNYIVIYSLRLLFFEATAMLTLAGPLSTKRHSLALCWDVKWTSRRQKFLDAWYLRCFTWQYTWTNTRGEMLASQTE
jgi:hypothetical protein